MKKNKYEVTVSGWFKFLATLAFVVFCFIVMTSSTSEDGAIAATLSLFAYTLLFVYLAVNGSNSKVAALIRERKIFLWIFFMPTIVLAFYSGGLLIIAGKKVILGVFSALLTILSIPFAFIMIRLQGGIRRWNAFFAFIALPVSLYVLCNAFPDSMVLVALVAIAIVFVVFFLLSLIQNIKDHRADDASEHDKIETGNYTAKWENKPDSYVRNNVIYLRGTINVDYYGEFYQSSADDAVRKLLNIYVSRVAAQMPGYSVDDNAEIIVKYTKID